jgi:hypothetical protein
MVVINARKRASNPRRWRPILQGTLHFQKLDVYQCAIEFLTVANRIRGHLPRATLTWQISSGAPRSRSHKTPPRDVNVPRVPTRQGITRLPGLCAAHLDVMKVESELYERGVDLLERIVAMLTKLIDP